MRKVHIILSVLISAAFVILGVFVFSASYVRFWEAITDMGKSVAVYFCEILLHPVHLYGDLFAAVLGYSVGRTIFPKTMTVSSKTRQRISPCS